MASLSCLCDTCFGHHEEGSMCDSTLLVPSSGDSNAATALKRAHEWECLYDESNRLWREAEARLDAVRVLLSSAGCDCSCDHSAEEHDDDCKRCFECRVEAAIK